MSKKAGLIVAVVVSLVVTGYWAAQEKPPAPPQGRHALLVGVTKYPSLRDSKWLDGPANDVVEMSKFLQEPPFSFPRENIKILLDAEGEANYPTHDNIKRAFEHLAKVVQKGDQVVILLAGHGSQQPKPDPNDPEDFDPAGMDQVFMPRDIGTWGTGNVARAIRDKDIKEWLKPIQDKDVHLLIIFDSCHSSSMVRGNDDIKTRGVDPVDLGVPKEAIANAAKGAGEHAPKSRGGPELNLSPFKQTSRVPKLVAIYAAQRTEETKESPLPPGAADRKPQGWLSYTLRQVVKQSPRRLTYAELVQRIHGEYKRQEWSKPMPLVEGTDMDKEFLGTKEWPGRTQLVISRQGEDGYKINAGAIHGLTKGSILSVFPRDLPKESVEEEKPIAYAKITTVRAAEADIEPVAFAGVALVKELPLEGRCKIAAVDYGDLRLRVALDTTGVQSRSAADNTVQEKLTAAEKKAQFLVEARPGKE